MKSRPVTFSLTYPNENQFRAGWLLYVGQNISQICHHINLFSPVNWQKADIRKFCQNQREKKTEPPRSGGQREERHQYYIDKITHKNFHHPSCKLPERPVELQQRVFWQQKQLHLLPWQSGSGQVVLSEKHKLHILFKTVTLHHRKLLKNSLCLGPIP